MKIGIYVSVICLLLVCFDGFAIGRKLCFKKKLYACQCLPESRAPLKSGAEHYITVWIHGIDLFKPNFYNIGLWQAHTFVQNESLFRIGKDLIDSDPVRFSSDKLLMYSWVGRFDYQECERAAGRLYDSLTQAVKKYEVQHNFRPKVRIITFSYGGNIVFNLPKFKDPRNRLVIDELILLAWPVQHDLVFRAKDSMFKKIFNVYSPSDCVQIIDPQGFCCRPFGKAPFFSGRRIQRADNVLQASIHLNGRGCGHFGLNGRRFVSLFPYILDELNDWFNFSQEHNLGMKKTRYILSIYTDKYKAHKLNLD